MDRDSEDRAPQVEEKECRAEDREAADREFREELERIIRFGLTCRTSALRTLLAGMWRRYRKERPWLADLISRQLRRFPASDDCLRGVVPPQEPVPPIFLGEGAPLPAFVNAHAILQACGPVFDADLAQRLDTIVRAWKDATRPGSRGPAPCGTILLHGPHGMGKTLAASRLAAMLDLPLHTIDVRALVRRRDRAAAEESGIPGPDPVIEVQDALDDARFKPWAIFWDNLDALAKKEAGEAEDRTKAEADPAADRQRAEAVRLLAAAFACRPAHSLFLGAAAAPERLDDDILALFGDDVSFRLPGPEEREKAVGHFGGAWLEGLDADVRAALERWLEGRSYGDIRKRLHAVRRCLVLDRDSVRDVLAMGLLRDLQEAGARAAQAAKNAQDEMDEMDAKGEKSAKEENDGERALRLLHDLGFADSDIAGMRGELAKEAQSRACVKQGGRHA